MLWNNDRLIDRLDEEYEELVGRVRRLVADTDAELLNRRPEDGKWSAAECIEHLNVSARLYMEPLAEAAEEGRAEGLTGPRADGRTLLGRLVVWSTEPPVRFGMQTQKELEPTAEHDPAELADSFAALHQRLITQLAAAEDLDRRRIKVRSLLDRRLNMSLDDWYAFLAAHGRRHLWQAERALDSGPD